MGQIEFFPSVSNSRVRLVVVPQREAQPLAAAELHEIVPFTFQTRKAGRVASQAISQLSRPGAPRQQTEPHRPRLSGLYPLAIASTIVGLLLGAILVVSFVADVTSSKAAVSGSLENNTSTEPQATLLLPFISAPSKVKATANQETPLPIVIDGAEEPPPESTVTITSLPQGSILSTGHRDGSTEWKLDPSEISGLQLMLPKTARGQTTLTLQLLAADGHVIADTTTTVEVTADEPAQIPVHSVKTFVIPTTWDEASQAPEAARVDEGPGEQATPATMAGVVPLPTRRPLMADTGASIEWIVTSAFINLRTEPTVSAAVVNVVAKGVKLRVRLQKRGWFKVTNPATSQEGWVYGANVQLLR